MIRAAVMKVSFVPKSISVPYGARWRRYQSSFAAKSLSSRRKAKNFKAQ